jgi:NitT/TauT family transport system permease protein
MTVLDRNADLALALPPIREEFELSRVIEPSADVERPLPLQVRILQSTLVRRLLVVGILAAVWEGYATYLDNPLMMPRLSEVIVALVSSFLTGGLGLRILMTLKVLAVGYTAGILAAAAITVLASTTRFGSDVLSTLTSMFNPLPAVALLPLALLWFGLGMGSLVFVIINSVLWVRRAQHAHRLSVGQRDAAHGRPLLRPRTACAGVRDPDSSSPPVDPGRAQDRLGLRMAHADRGGTRVRRKLRSRRSWLVYLREPQQS